MKDDKIDYIVENIGAINKTLEFQSKQLESHIKRTELLEARFEPVEDHVKFVNGLLKVVVYLSSISGLIALCLKVVGKL